MLLATAVRDAVPTLAICLGHQLLAVATGGRVARSGHRSAGRGHPAGRSAGGGRHRSAARSGPGRRRGHPLERRCGGGPAAGGDRAGPHPGRPASRRCGWAGRPGGVQFHPEVDPALVGAWAAADVVSGHLTAERADSWLAPDGAARRHRAGGDLAAVHPPFRRSAAAVVGLAAPSRRALPSADERARPAGDRPRRSGHDPARARPAARAAGRPPRHHHHPARHLDDVQDRQAPAAGPPAGRGAGR